MLGLQQASNICHALEADTANFLCFDHLHPYNACSLQCPRCILALFVNIVYHCQYIVLPSCVENCATAGTVCDWPTDFTGDDLHLPQHTTARHKVETMACRDSERDKREKVDAIRDEEPVTHN